MPPSMPWSMSGSPIRAMCLPVRARFRFYPGERRVRGSGPVCSALSLMLHDAFDRQEQVINARRASFAEATSSIGGCGIGCQGVRTKDFGRRGVAGLCAPTAMCTATGDADFARYRDRVPPKARPDFRKAARCLLHAGESRQTASLYEHCAADARPAVVLSAPAANGLPLILGGRTGTTL